MAKESENQEIIGISHSMHKFFKNVFKDFIKDTKNSDKTVTEAEGEETPKMAEPLPFRIEKYNVTSTWYTPATQIKSALKDGANAPAWANCYPFTAVEGVGLGLGIDAVSSSKAKWGKTAYNSIGELKNVIVTLLNSGNPNVIGLGAKVLFPNTFFTASSYKVSQKNFTDRNTYKTVNEYLLAQQFYDINDEGKLYVNPSRTNGVVIGSILKQNDAILVKVTDADKHLIKARFRLNDKNDYFRIHVLPEITGKNIGFAYERSTKRGELGKKVQTYTIVSTLKGDNKNEKYNRYGEFFKSRGVTEIKTEEDVRKCQDIFMKLSDDEFIDMFLDYGLMSDKNRSYVWYPVNTSAHQKDIKIAELANSSNIFDLGKESTLTVGESLEESRQSICEAEDNSRKLPYEFLRQMAMCVNPMKPSSFVLSCLIDKNYRLMNLNGEVLNQDASKSGLIRLFIEIEDNVRSALDFTPVFSEYKDILSQEAPKKLFVGNAVGKMTGYQFNPTLEKDAGGTENVGKRHGTSIQELFDLYKGSKEAANSGFNVCTMVPQGKTKDVNSYFFFLNYSSPNGRDEIHEPENEASKAVLSAAVDEKVVASSQIWYNSVLERGDSGKKNIKKA